MADKLRKARGSKIREKNTTVHSNPQPDYLCIQYFGEKGRGIVAKEKIDEGSFVVLFVGKKTTDEPIGDDTYIYEIRQRNKYWIDATEDDGSFGRLINDDNISPNLRVRMITFNGEDLPGFFALRDIYPGEELTYNYGGKGYAWRKVIEFLPAQEIRKLRYFESSCYFICSTKSPEHKVLKNWTAEVVEKCGGKYCQEFNCNITHVIMHTDEPRCCGRSLKYLLGIAHHCWILDKSYISMCAQAGYFLPEEDFEILGDEVFPRGGGASLSRQSKKKLLRGLKIHVSDDLDNIPIESAKEIILSLGGELGMASSCNMSLSEKGGPNTVSKEWLIDCMSTFTLCDKNLYYNVEQHQSSDNTSDMEMDNELDEDYVPESEDETSDYQSDIEQANMIQDQPYPNQIDPDIVVNSPKETEQRRSSDDRSNMEMDDEMGENYVPESEGETSDNKSDTDQANIIQDQSCPNQIHSDVVVNLPKDNGSIIVKKSIKHPNGSRIWDKKHACLYCSKSYPKLARHLQQVHSGELEVQRALAFEKSSRERWEAWKSLLQKGDFSHNSKVYLEGKGEIIPVKRPKTEREGTSYVQCGYCYGTYLRSQLWRHVKNSHKESTREGMANQHQINSASLIPVPSAVKNDFKENVLNRMTNNQISLIARTDVDIAMFGQRMYLKYARNPHYYSHIRQKMREMARFLQMFRTVDSSVSSLRDCIDPKKFAICVATVKQLCGYKEENHLFDVPSLAKKIGHSLHKVAGKLRTESLANGNKSLQEKADAFIELYKEEWEVEISHAALETLRIHKYNKPSRIPLAEDLKALSSYLKKRAKEITVLPEISQIEWRDLCEVTLAQIVLFNKRRAGEAERLEVRQYLDGLQNSKTMQTEILESLSPLERKLAEVIDRVEIRGKRGRRVAILLPQDLRNQLDILLRYRQDAAISTENIYIFARPNDSQTPLRATDVLRKFSSACGAKQPETLTSTGFRKHVATVSQMLNLKENELDVLAQFLGHDIRVHREFYRLPEDTIQIAKVSKLLLEMERGTVHNYKGKSLDEIQFDLNEPLEYELDGAEQEELRLPEVEEDTQESRPVSVNKMKKIKGRSCSKHITWKEEEKSAVERQLGSFFYLSRLPGKHLIVEAQKKETSLQKRPWTQIKYYIKNKKTSLSRNKHNQEQLIKAKFKISELETQLNSKNTEIEKLLTRLSELASARLLDENPNIADLSDINRPTKLAEQYSELYDNEWTNAFDHLSEQEGLNENQTAMTLLNVLQTIYKVCQEKADKQIKRLLETISEFSKSSEIPTEMKKQLKESRKKKYKEYLPDLEKTTQCELLKIDTITNQNLQEIAAYHTKCLEICWLMCIQDPPVFIDCNTDFHGQEFSKSRYRTYTKAGQYIDFLVWPSVYLHKDGVPLFKGVVECMQVKDESFQPENTAVTTAGSRSVPAETSVESILKPVCGNETSKLENSYSAESTSQRVTVKNGDNETEEAMHTTVTREETTTNLGKTKSAGTASDDDRIIPEDNSKPKDQRAVETKPFLETKSTVDYEIKLQDKTVSGDETFCEKNTLEDEGTAKQGEVTKM